MGEYFIYLRLYLLDVPTGNKFSDTPSYMLLSSAALSEKAFYRIIIVQPKYITPYSDKYKIETGTCQDNTTNVLNNITMLCDGQLVTVHTHSDFTVTIAEICYSKEQRISAIAQLIQKKTVPLLVFFAVSHCLVYFIPLHQHKMKVGV